MRAFAVAFLQGGSNMLQLVSIHDSVLPNVAITMKPENTMLVLQSPQLWRLVDAKKAPMLGLSVGAFLT